ALIFKACGATLAGGVWSFGFWTWRRHSRLSLHRRLELDRFAVKCLDDSWRTGSSRSVADKCRENLRVLLRAVFWAGVYRHRLCVACTICSSPVAPCSRGGTRTLMHFQNRSRFFL